MSETTARTVRTVYGCVLSIFLVLTGLSLILSALSIYYTGVESPYTPLAIASRFAVISPLVWGTLAVLAVGIVLHFLLPAKSPRPRAIPDARARLLRTEGMRDTENAAYAEVSRRERKYRLRLRLVTAALVLLSALPAVFHLSNPESYRYPEYNDSVIAAMPVLLLFSAVLTVGLTLCVLLCDRSYARQAKALSAAARTEAPEKALSAAARTEAPEKAPTRKPVTLVLRLLILAAALILLAIGIAGGGMADVLSKAINICTECIGLG